MRALLEDLSDGPIDEIARLIPMFKSLVQSAWAVRIALGTQRRTKWQPWNDFLKRLMSPANWWKSGIDDVIGGRRNPSFGNGARYPQVKRRSLTFAKTPTANWECHRGASTCRTPLTLQVKSPLIARPILRNGDTCNFTLPPCEDVLNPDVTRLDTHFHANKSRKWLF